MDGGRRKGRKTRRTRRKRTRRRSATAAGPERRGKGQEHASHTLTHTVYRREVKWTQRYGSIAASNGPSDQRHSSALRGYAKENKKNRGFKYCYASLVNFSSSRLRPLKMVNVIIAMLMGRSREGRSFMAQPGSFYCRSFHKHHSRAVHRLTK